MFKSLKKPIIIYVVSGVLLACTIFLNITIKNNNDSLQKIPEKLIRVKANLSTMRASTQEIEKLLVRFKKYIPSNFQKGSTEGELFSALDKLKSRMKKAEIVTLKISDSPDKISLPVKITGPLKNYATFVNDAGYLRSLKFPFFTVKNISLVRKEDKDGLSVTYLIDGVFHMPKK